MAPDELTRAGKALRCYRLTGAPRSGRVKTFVFALSLCLLVLVGTSCAQVSATQAGSGSTTTTQQSKKQITYVAIGASDTFGIGTDDPYTENWPTDLAGMLGASHIHLINLGIPAITIHDVLSQELPIALDSHPDLVTIWLGVNDIADSVPASSFARDLNTLLARLRANSPHARIAIANIPDLTLLPYFNRSKAFDAQALSQQIQTYNAAIDSYTRRYQAILVDLTQQNYNLQQHPEYISHDGLHPNDLGYRQLAKLFYKALGS
ncbi:MAG TPA: SGNH/GDSL hydrolase family protein [Ktedonobacteraceae bacterium]|nr:SGNH/GDSL hydrolase family protein [Ktedonobacteraceae bacterium]